jgi:hypothetical protein
MPIKFDSWDDLRVKTLDEGTKEDVNKYHEYNTEVFDSYYVNDIFKKVYYLLYELQDVKTFMRLLFYEELSVSWLGYKFENYNGKIILKMNGRDWLIVISKLIYKDFHKELCITGRWNLRRILILVSFFAEYLTEKDLDIILKKLPNVLKKYRTDYLNIEEYTWLFLIQTFKALNKQEFVDKIYATMLFEENK